MFENCIRASVPCSTFFKLVFFGAAPHFSKVCMLGLSTALERLIFLIIDAGNSCFLPEALLRYSWCWLFVSAGFADTNASLLFPGVQFRKLLSFPFI